MFTQLQDAYAQQFIHCVFKLCDLAMNLQFTIIRTSQLKPVYQATLWGGGGGGLETRLNQAIL